VDFGRRGSDYIFGAFKPADGEAFTAPYDGRTIANWVDFLERDFRLSSRRRPLGNRARAC
jgi:hypothetical protein